MEATRAALSMEARLGPAWRTHEAGGCTMDAWRPHSRLIVIEPRGPMDAAITEWGLEQMSEVLMASRAVDRRCAVVWNLASVTSYTTAVRRLCVDWFRRHSRGVARHVVLLSPNPLVKMAVSIAGAVGVELTQHVYTDQQRFLRVFEETLAHFEKG